MYDRSFDDVLRGLHNPNFDTLLQAVPALSSFGRYIKDAALVLAQPNSCEDSLHCRAVLQEYGLARVLFRFADTALLQLQQQPILQAPLDALAVVYVICDALAHMMQLIDHMADQDTSWKQQAAEATAEAAGATPAAFAASFSSKHTGSCRTTACG
jgi:hypothetical protein